jgi:uncharacterized membrane protein YbjE (DUF340 family)
MPSASFFEAVMLICFGLAWPVSIYKSWIARCNDGKSIYFLYVIIIGYISGVIFQHMIATPGNKVIYLYYLNICMVATDIAIYYRNVFLTQKNLHNKPFCH